MIAALLLAANVVVVSKAPIAQWTDAPGRKSVALLAPGAILRGYSYTGKAARGPVLLMFGGDNQNTKTLDAAARGFTRKASRVVVYDYRGYGFSTGVAGWDNSRSDAVRLYDATLAGSSVKRVVVLGCCSTGSDIAAYVATQRPVAGFILIPGLPGFDKPATLRQIRAPLLVFEDEHLEKIAASPDKRFVAIVGAKHNGLLELPASQAAVAAFLDHVANL